MEPKKNKIFWVIPEVLPEKVQADVAGLDFAY